MFKKGMKVLTAMLLFVVAIVALAPRSYANEIIFSDVPADHWAYAAIMEAYEDEVVNGTGYDEAGRRVYSPSDKVTEAQFVTILTRAFYNEEVKNCTVKGDWYVPNSWVANLHQLRTNVPKMKFDTEVTREVMAQMMYNVMVDQGAVLPNEAELQQTMSRISDFDSVSTDNRTAVAACYYLELITGMDAQGSFAPKGLINRAQTSVIYVRLKKAVNALSGIAITNPGATTPVTPTTPETPTDPGTTPVTPPQTEEPTTEATLTNGLPVTEENVLALIEEYRNGKEPGEKAKEAGFTSYVDMAKYDAYEPPYRLKFPNGFFSGTACAKFAFAFSDDLFGDLPVREISYVEVRPGDILHFDGHWAIAVLPPSYDYQPGKFCTKTVDGGSVGELSYGTIYRSLDSSNLLAAYTRYPE